MTKGTQGNTCKSVVSMFVHKMIENFFNISVEIPKIGDDMIKSYKMMAFKILVSSAFQANRTFVSFYPFSVGKGSTNSQVYGFQSQGIDHAFIIVAFCMSFYAIQAFWALGTIGSLPTSYQ